MILLCNCVYLLRDGDMCFVVMSVEACFVKYLACTVVYYDASIHCDFMDCCKV